MTGKAEQHLAKARQYVAQGDQLNATSREFYSKAAGEILAARKEGASIRDAADALAKSERWVAAILAWDKTPANPMQGTADLPFSEPKGVVAARHAKSVLREADDETLSEIMESLPVARRAAVVRAAVPPPERSASVNSGPTFIDLLVRVSSALIELEAMVGGWQNPSAIPAEFSRESFNDIVAKVLRIQDHFDEMVEAVDDEDEFQKIVRNFRVVADVS